MSLGSIVVDLLANTGSFVSGMQVASSAAKKAGREIEDSFSKFGRLAETLLGPFGEVGAEIGRVFESAGRLSGGAAKELAELGGGMSYLAVGAGVAAGAMAAVTGAATGLAISTAYSVREMAEQAEAIGVSVGTLAELSFAAKQAGVEHETLVKSLGKMAASAVKAATGPSTAATAFSRLGISVKDTNGQLKDAGKLFDETIEKLDALKNRTAAVGLSREIFGRGGQEILKFNPEEEKAARQTANDLGIVPSPQLAQQSIRFVQSINTIEAAGHGLAIRLTTELLPAISGVADQIVKAFENKSGPIYALADGVIWVAKAAFFLVDAFITAGEQIALFSQSSIDRIEELAKAFPKIGKTKSPSELVAAWKDSREKLKAIDDKFNTDSKKAWQDLENTRQNLFGPKPPTNNATSDGNKTGVADLEPKQKDDTVARIEKEVGALERKAAAELKLAAATGQSTAQQRLQAAQTQGEEVIEKFKDDADEKLKNKKITVAEYQKILATLKTLGPQIQTAEAEIFIGKDLTAGASEFQKESDAIAGHIDALNRLAQAYRAGGDAIKDALINQQLEKQKEKLQDLEEEYDKLAATQGVAPEKLAQAAKALSNAKASFNLNENSLSVQGASASAESVAKQTRAFEDQLPALQRLNAAYHENAEAVREAQVDVKVQQFKTQNPFASDDTVKQFAKQQEIESRQSQQSTIDQESVRYDLIKTYDEEVTKLQLVKTNLEAYGQDALAVDAALDEAKDKEILGWDKVALKIGDVGQQFRAMVNEIEHAGDNFGEKVFGTLSKSIDGVSGELAKFITTGKANFQSFFQGIEEQLIKAQLQKGFSLLFTKYLGEAQVPGGGKFGKSGLDNLPLTNLDGSPVTPLAPNGKPPLPAGALGGLGKLFGLDTAPKLGTASNPMFVKFADGTFPTNLSTSGAAGVPTVGSNLPLSGDLSKPDGTESNPFYTQFANGQTGLYDNFAERNASAPTSTVFDPYTALASTGTSAASPLSTSAPSSLGGINSLLGGLSKATSSTGLGGIFSALQGGVGATGSILKLIQALNPGQFGASGLDSLPLISASDFSGLSSFAGDTAGIASTAADAADAGASGLSDFADFADFFAFAEGGPVKGPGSSTSDSIPAMLSDGEYVLKADAVRGIGIKNLDALNNSSLSKLKPVGNFFSSTSPALAHMTKSLSAINFGGFRELGGSVTPGNAYVVGERRPELFVPKTAGTIIPSVNSKSANGDSQPVVYSTTIHVHGVHDADSFRKSQGQIMADTYRSAQAQHQRNRTS